MWCRVGVASVGDGPVGGPFRVLVSRVRPSTLGRAKVGMGFPSFRIGVWAVRFVDSRRRDGTFMVDSVSVMGTFRKKKRSVGILI